ncbi:peptidase M14 [Caenimonas terrae]|uniref:Peptidase M14 n=1 Tax=Caenimonas terrae TaxID=696074 RepID=A0ABW0NGH9_9BURK
MTDTVLFETTVPRTLDSWVERFGLPQWRGASVEGWLFEGVAARRAAEEQLRAAGVTATLRSAYKPLVHCFLEEIDCSALAHVTVRYPVHPGASERRFLLEAYPLAALLPGGKLEFVAGGADLHYELTLTWNDGRRQQLDVFAPNRSHTGPSGIDHLSPTGWLRVRGAGPAPIDGAQQTEHEQLFEKVLQTVQDHAWPQAEPYFERLEVRIELPGIEQELPLLQESISTHEALHEDIYFSLLEIFQRRSGRAPGDRRLQPGQIVPDIRASDRSARLRIALRPFDPAPPKAQAADRSVPLDLLLTAPEPARITAEIDGLSGERFAATSRQGRAVTGLYHRGSAAPVFISGGQHANETSGIVGALRAATVLQAQDEAHFALVALENPDGYALQRELAAHNPGHMHHAARYTALGDDVEFRTEPPLYERAAREQAVALSGAQLHVNLHGYPAHEWTRPWSGYLPQGFELWTVPKGFFLVLRHHAGWGREARALLEQVCAALAKVPGLADFNARQLALYQRHAGAPAFETIHGISCTVAAVDRPGAPVTLITEFPDETVHGEAFRFAHTVQTETVLAAVRAWQALARR